MRARACVGVGASLCAMVALLMTGAMSAGTPVSFDIAATVPPQLRSSEVEAMRQFLLQQQASRRDAVEDGDGGPPNGIALQWVEAATSQADITRDNGILTLKVMNLDPRAQTVQATVIGDAGTLQSRARSEPAAFTLPAGSLQPLTVETIATPSEPWSFSGAVAVHVRACPIDAPANARCHIAVSAPLFFHPIGLGPQMQFYGEAALASAHASGDLRADATGATGAATTQPLGTARVMGGGPLSVDPAVDGGVTGEGR